MNNSNIINILSKILGNIIEVNKLNELNNTSKYIISELKKFNLVIEENWKPIEQVPIPNKLSIEEGWIIGLTIHNNVVVARYIPDGNYVDNWGHDNVRYKLKAFRELPKND